MSNRWRAVLTAAFLALASHGCGTSWVSPHEVAHRVLSGLVLIVTQGLDGQDIAQASGFFIGNDLVATNLHVFKAARYAYVKTVGDGINYQIDHVVAFDRVNDLCILRLKGVKAKSLSLGSSKEIAVGEDVFVAGNPEGLEGSLSKGIISAIRTDSGLIQIDAAISPGSSGGPVVNSQGKVIGIARGGMTDGQNLNFAIPIERLINLEPRWTLSVRQVASLALPLRVPDTNDLRGPVRTVNEIWTIPIERLRWQSRNTPPNAKLPGWQPYELEPGRFTFRTFWVFNERGDLVAQTRSSLGVTSFDSGLQYNERAILSHVVEERFDLESSASTGKPERKPGQKKETTFNEQEGVKIMCARNSWVDEERGYSLWDGTDRIAERFDSTGRVIERNNSPDDGIVHKTTMTYGADGLVAEEQSYDDGDLSSVSRFVYEKDYYGNWIKKTEFERYAQDETTQEWEKVNVWTREIGYYKK